MTPPRLIIVGWSDVADRAEALREGGMAAEEAWCMAAGVSYKQRPKVGRAMSTTARVIGALEQQSAPITAADLARVVGVDRRAAQSSLRLAERQGRARVVGHERRASFGTLCPLWVAT